MRKLIVFLILVCFIASGMLGVLPVNAQEALILPAPGTRISLSRQFNPPMLKGIKVHPDNPLHFDFILDVGSIDLSGATSAVAGAISNEAKEESVKLLKYFLAALTTPEKDLWVNLSPYEKDRIIPDGFGRTEMGRDLLAQDYILKQITASLMYPEGPTGKQFWARVYREAVSKLGTTRVPVNTFNKVWIVPATAVVKENASSRTAYVVESTLKVMLEQDYLAASKNVHSKSADAETSGIIRATEGSLLSKECLQDIVIPVLNKEINEGKNFAPLRQVYNSLILAAWYKKKIKQSIINQVYSDRNKVDGLHFPDDIDGQKIYARYLKAFKKGVYSYVREEADPVSGRMVPRKYFSGGVTLDLSRAMIVERAVNAPVPKGVEFLRMLGVNLDPVDGRDVMDPIELKARIQLAAYNFDRFDHLRDAVHLFLTTDVGAAFKLEAPLKQGLLNSLRWMELEVMKIQHNYSAVDSLPDSFRWRVMLVNLKMLDRGIGMFNRLLESMPRQGLSIPAKKELNYIVQLTEELRRTVESKQQILAGRDLNMPGHRSFQARAMGEILGQKDISVAYEIPDTTRIKGSIWILGDALASLITRLKPSGSSGDGIKIRVYNDKQGIAIDLNAEGVKVNDRDLLLRSGREVQEYFLQSSEYLLAYYAVKDMGGSVKVERTATGIVMRIERLSVIQEADANKAMLTPAQMNDYFRTIRLELYYARRRTRSGVENNQMIDMIDAHLKNVRDLLKEIATPQARDLEEILSRAWIFVKFHDPTQFAADGAWENILNKVEAMEEKADAPWDMTEVEKGAALFLLSKLDGVVSSPQEAIVKTGDNLDEMSQQYGTIAVGTETADMIPVHHKVVTSSGKLLSATEARALEKTGTVMLMSVDQIFIAVNRRSLTLVGKRTGKGAGAKTGFDRAQVTASAPDLLQSHETGAKEGNNTGGIDLNAVDRMLRVDGGVGTIDMHVDPAMLEGLRQASGLEPAIVSMIPLRDLNDMWSP